MIRKIHHHHRRHAPDTTSSLPFVQSSSANNMVQQSMFGGDEFVSTNTPFLVALVALLIGVAAQTFINQMLEGDRGLGAFLKDGTGYNKSGFRQQDGKRAEERSDPLPWLKLPKLDFVEVAGQEKVDDSLIFAKLEELRIQMNQQLDQGNIVEASRLKEELEELMEVAGIDFESEWE